MALWIQGGGLRLVNDDVAALNLIVDRIGDFAGGDAFCEVPVEPVVGGREMQGRRQLVGASAQQGQFFRPQVGFQIIEAEQRGAQGPVIHATHGQ